MFSNPKFKKVIITTLLVILCLQISGVFLLYPKQAQAFSPGVVAVNTAKWVWDKIEKVYKFARDLTTQLGMDSAINVFFQNMASDMATDLASGGPGGKSLFYHKPWGDYLTDAGQDAAGEYIGSLSEVFGVDLCEPAFPSVKWDLTIGLLGYAVPKLERIDPKCEWSDIVRNWETFAATAKSGEFLNNFQFLYGFKKGNDFGLAMGLIDDVDKARREAEAAAEKKRQEGEGTKPASEGKISGFIQTPAVATKNLLKQLQESGEKNKSLQTIGGYIKGNVFLSTFFNTLASKLMERLIGVGTGLWSPGMLLPEEGADLSGESMARAGARREAEKVFSDLLTVRIEPGGEIDIVAEYSTCPSDTRYAGLNNCVVDQGLAEAIRNKLTIKEAIDQGYLHGDWLVASSGVKDSPSDYLKRYSLTNIKKLRKARIVPLGLEIAARMVYSQTFEGNITYNPTLSKIVAGFRAPDYDPTDPTTDQPGTVAGGDYNPWWHLVDPDWVLDAPAARCAAQVNGYLPQPNSPTRQETCAALESCLSLDESGACAEWGYCTKEKVVRDFDGDQCPEYYASCRKFKRDEDGRDFYYLQNTLDFNGCDENSYGCNWYSTFMQPSGDVWNWIDPLLSSDNSDSDSDNDDYRLYLNHNAQECDSSEAGCTELLQLKDAEGNATYVPIDLRRYLEGGFWGKTSEKTYLKVAPDHYSCYAREFIGADEGINFYGYVEGDGLDECEGYAKGCSVEEAGCKKYTPTNGDPWIPAVIDPAVDYCPAECAGYQKFSQEPLWWDELKTYTDLGPPPFTFEAYPTDGFVNIIPQNARQCSAGAVGCEEYTNLDAVAAGGEGREDYTYARSCQKPENTLCKPYYTWEGDDRVGYQLKAYNLIKYSSIPDNNPPCTQLNLDLTGEPIVSSTCGGTESCSRGVCSLNPNAECNSDSDCELVAAGTCMLGANPDCFEFYDELGNVFYALKSATITCDDDCHLYRKATVDVTGDDIFGEDDCPSGHWTGDVDGECMFTIMPSESTSCSAGDAGCREYHGNSYGNIKKVVEDDFEDGSYDNWSGSSLSVSPDSIFVGGSSLKVTAGTQRDVYELIKNNKTYVLSFLAKGISVNLDLDIVFEGHTEPNDVFDSSLALTDDWQPYTVGPVYTADWGDTVANLQFIATIGSDFFLDQVVLKEVQDDVFLIKDSWNTPASCSIDMLGCQEYKDSDNLTVYLKSFTDTCPENKIGCKGFIDTRNSDSSSSERFNNDNYICSSGSRDGWPCESETDTDCTGAGGSCVLDTDDDITTPNDRIIYLVDDEDKRCNAANAGCTNLGLPYFEPDGTTISGWDDLYLINDPDKYISTEENYVAEPILCQDNQAGCDKFTNSDGGTTYFIDPEGFTCEYQEGVSLGAGLPVDGWFKSGLPGEPCGPGAAYEDIPKSIDDDYEGRAGICTADNDMCTEFKDPMGVDSSVYYIKDDDFLQNDCNGMVSKKDGCLLYSDTSLTEDGEVINNWSAKCTYAVSEYLNGAPFAPIKLTGMSVVEYESLYGLEICGKLVMCVLGGGEDDSNIILQKRDAHRECAEWLGCDEYREYWDKNSSQYTRECSALIRQTEKGDISLEAASLINNNCDPASPTDCGNQIETGLVCVDRDSNGSYECTPENLTKDAYANRNVNLNNFGAEYSGYSLYGIYPLDLLEKKQYVNDDQWYLTCFAGSGEEIGIGVNVGSEGNYGFVSCASDEDCFPELTGLVCKRDALGSRCVAPKACRGFPEADSPFRALVDPVNIGGEYIGPVANVNLCEVLAINDTLTDEDFQRGCQCHYNKVNYGGETKYYPFSAPIPSGICITGDKDLIETMCQFPSDCCDDGIDVETRMCKNSNNTPTCTYYSRKDTYLGWEGSCLELDPSKVPNPNDYDNIFDIFSCLTWWPIDRALGDLDIEDTHIEAGYWATGGRQWYCQEETEGEIYKHGGSKCKDGMNISDTVDFWCWPAGGDIDGEDCEDNAHIIHLPYDWPDIRESEIKKITVNLGVNENGDCNDEGVCGYEQTVTMAKPFPGEAGSCQARAGGQYYREKGWYAGVSDASDACLNFLYEWNPTDLNCGDCSDDDDDDIAALKIRAVFEPDPVDPDEQILSHFETFLASKSGSPCFHYKDIQVHAKGPCKYIINVTDDGDLNEVKHEGNPFTTVAWTNRMWSGSDYYENHQGEMECEPYGAAGIRTLGDYTNMVLADNPDFPGECIRKKANITYPTDIKLTDLFARSYGTREWNKTENKYKDYTALGDGPPQPWNLTDTLASGHWKPQVESYFESNYGEVCSKCHRDTFTLSALQSDGSSFESDGHDVDGDGIDDNLLHINSGTEATAYFYGYVCTDHMPIRGRRISWGDGDFWGEVDDLMARNHKKCERKCKDPNGSVEFSCIGCDNKADCYGECDDADADCKWTFGEEGNTRTVSGIKTCSDSSVCQWDLVADSFGETFEACETNPWSFTHTYRCDPDNVPECSSLNCAGDLNCVVPADGCYDGDYGACVYRPRVHIKDNWGWCTGECVGRTDGCYGDSECDIGGDNDDYDPWIYFDGQVIVTP